MLAAAESAASTSWLPMPGEDYEGSASLGAEAEYATKAYTGREWDRETGLYYYRARYYDPKAGRFISEDPIGLSSGEVNFYSYARGNPLKYVDPDGLTVRVTLWLENPLATEPGHAQLEIFNEAGVRTAALNYYPESTEAALPVSSGSLVDPTATAGGRQRDIGNTDGAQVIEIDGLNEEAMQTWIERFIAKNPNYQLFARNCATVVARALQVGAASGYLARFMTPSTGFIWTPHGVKTYANELRLRGQMSGMRR